MKRLFRYPVFQSQAGHAGELARVIGDKGQPEALRMRSDQRIERANGLTSRGKGRADRAVGVGCLGIERGYLDGIERALQTQAGLGSALTPRDAVAQLRRGDRRDDQLPRIFAVEAVENGLVVGAGVEHIHKRVGVEHVLHQSPQWRVSDCADWSRSIPKPCGELRRAAPIMSPRRACCGSRKAASASWIKALRVRPWRLQALSSSFSISGFRRIEVGMFRLPSDIVCSTNVSQMAWRLRSGPGMQEPTSMGSVGAQWWIRKPSLLASSVEFTPDRGPARALRFAISPE